jgi:hypothetical protein
MKVAMPPEVGCTGTMVTSNEDMDVGIRAKINTKEAKRHRTRFVSRLSFPFPILIAKLICRLIPPDYVLAVNAIAAHFGFIRRHVLVELDYFIQIENAGE